MKTSLNCSDVVNISLILDQTAENLTNPMCQRRVDHVNLHTRDMHTMKTLWYSIVQPHIDYYSQIWTPHRVRDIQKIESLFRLFSSKLFGSTISRQGVLSGEEDGKIRTYIHLENNRRNCPTFWNKIIHINKACRLCRVPIPHIQQCTTGKVRAIRGGSLQNRAPQIYNSIPLNIRDQTGCVCVCVI